MPANRKVLITGGSGFIGSHLVASAVARRCSVYAVHRGADPPWRLAEAVQSPCLTLVPNCDLMEGNRIEEVLQVIQPDVVVHAAAYGVQAQLTDVRAAVGTNILGTVHLLDASVHSGVRRFIMLGTAYEYADRDAARDENAPLRPTTLYGITKSAASSLADYYCREIGLPVITLRPFGAFGPKEDVRKLIPYIITRALRGESVKLIGGGQTRDYLYVTDVANAALMAISGELPEGQVFNVASERGIAVEQLVRVTLRLMNSDVPVEPGAPCSRPAISAPLVGDAGKLRSRGWSPRYTLEQGLEQTIDWYSRILGIQPCKA